MLGRPNHVAPKELLNERPTSQLKKIHIIDIWTYMWIQTHSVQKSCTIFSVEEDREALEICRQYKVFFPSTPQRPSIPSTAIFVRSNTEYD